MKAVTSMNRKEARECAFKILFSKEFSENTAAIELYSKEVDASNYTDDEYVRAVLGAIDNHEPEIESAIAKYAVGWKLNRVSAVSRSILKLAIAELFYIPEIPMLVSLNEAIELSKNYDTEKAYGFINGVLNAAMKDPRAFEIRK